MADQSCNRINLPLELSSSSPSWWDFHHHATRPTPSSSSWNNTAPSAANFWESNHKNSNSSPSDQEDVSITASNHSSLTVDESTHPFFEPSSSSNNFIGERASDNNYLWSQLLLGVGEGQEMPGDLNDEMGENLLNSLSLKSFSGGIFESSAACSDYLKKLHSEKWADSNGDHFPNSNTNTSFTNNFSKHSFNNNVGDSNLIESDQTKQNLAYQQQLFDMGQSVGNSSFDYASYSFNHTRPGNYRPEEIDQAGSNLTALLPKLSINNTESGHRSIGGNWRPRESNMLIDPFSHSRKLLLSKPLLKSLSLLDTRKHQGHLSKPLINKGIGRGQGGASTNEAKKKRSDHTCQSSCSLKKPKHESSSFNPSTASPSAKTTNTQTPKVKIAAEKISALQQIVSPYGKTDTASVMQEAIGFIKCLQEQVQLLTNPYLKSSVNKLQEAWGRLDRKFDKGEKNKVFDLKSKGLCLVPTSSIPQVYKDESGPDYWPTYRGCLYR